MIDTNYVGPDPGGKRKLEHHGVFAQSNESTKRKSEEHASSRASQRHSPLLNLDDPRSTSSFNIHIIHSSLSVLLCNQQQHDPASFYISMIATPFTLPWDEKQELPSYSTLMARFIPAFALPMLLLTGLLLSTFSFLSASFFWSYRSTFIYRFYIK